VCFARRSWHAFSVPVRGEADFCLSVRSVAGSVGERYPQLRAVIEEPDTAAMAPARSPASPQKSVTTAPPSAPAPTQFNTEKNDFAD
jgi:hypothetical protein